MKKGKPFFYRIDLIDLFDFATEPECEGMTLLQFAEILNQDHLPVKLKIKGPFSVDKHPRPCRETWRVVKTRILKRDDYTCAYCGSRGGILEVDHIHPVSKGGSHEDVNLTTACLPCNRSKSNKTVEEWRADV